MCHVGVWVFSWTVPRPECSTHIVDGPLRSSPVSVYAGQTHLFEVGPNATVADVKELVQTREGKYAFSAAVAVPQHGDCYRRFSLYTVLSVCCSQLLHSTPERAAALQSVGRL